MNQVENADCEVSGYPGEVPSRLRITAGGTSSHRSGILPGELRQRSPRSQAFNRSMIGPIDDSMTHLR